MPALPTTEYRSPTELREVITEQLRLLLEQRNYEGAKALLVPVQPVDIAEALDGLAKPMSLVAFRLLPRNKAVEVYEYCSTEVQEALIEEFQDQEILDIVNSMAPDDRAMLFDELPPQVVRRILPQLTPEERQATSQLLGYQPQTAGRLMTPEYIYLKDELTVAQAADKVRELARDREVSYYVYTTDDHNKLAGVMSLRDLLLTDPNQPLQEVMNRDVIFAYTDTDQEEAAQLIQRYDLNALPIVDREKVLVGVMTVDDAMDVLQQETTEDIYTMGAVRSEGDSYFQANLVSVTRKRLPWLFILLLTNTLTILVMSNFEEILDQVVALAFFTPLLIDTGGSIGAQSSTVVIRGLSTDELKHRRPWWVIVRECVAGGILGIFLAIAVIVLVFVTMGETAIGITVGVSLLGIAIVAATIGALLPFVFDHFKLDPAMMSAPFITTVVDILGIFIYLSIATMMLGLA
ncbi:MAG: magnesium transporter [Leptolyngbyaceae cyanobacterium SM2_5_2]|nr:magnesium transporter [Leptolyngbyaceae cyanobacterium SM2_5_2]